MVQTLNKRRGNNRILIRRRVDVGPVLFERRESQDRRRKDRRFDFGHNDFLPKYNLPISRSYIYEKIEVRDPYYALENLVMVDANTMTARVQPEQPLGLEVPPISAAEAGRHLAILGSCVCSMINPNSGKHFYLAMSAELKRITAKPKPGGKYLYAKAQGKILSKKLAVAKCTISNQADEIIYHLWVQYTIIPEKVFLKCSSENKFDLRSLNRSLPKSLEKEFKQTKKRRNPYLDAWDIQSDYHTPNSLITSLGLVHFDLCNGHFPNVPAFPIAILAFNFFNSTNKFLELSFGHTNFKYCIQHASVRASNLAFSSQEVWVKVRNQQNTKDKFRFYTQAFSKEKMPVGNMSFVLDFEESPE